MASCVLHMDLSSNSLAQTSQYSGSPTNIIHTGEPGHEVRLAILLVCFAISFRKEVWVDRVQLLQLTKKKNTEYLLERHEVTNGAFSGNRTTVPAVNIEMCLLSNCRACEKKNHSSLCCKFFALTGRENTFESACSI